MTMSLLTRADVARVLNISHTAADDWYKKGMLPPPDATLGGQPLWREETIRAVDVKETRRICYRALRKPISSLIERHLGAILDHARAETPQLTRLADALASTCAEHGVCATALHAAAKKSGTTYTTVRARLYQMAASWALTELEKRASNGCAAEK